MSDDDENIEWEYEDESDADEQTIDAADNTVTEAHGDGHREEDQEFAYSDADDDVDWEDASERQNEPIPSHEPPADDQQEEEGEDIVSDLNAVNWDHINSVLQRQAEKENGSSAGDGKTTSKRKPVRMTKQDKAQELALHKSHLLLLLASQQRMNELCRSCVLRALVLSLTSDSALDFFKEVNKMPRQYLLELLVRWFHGHFRLPNYDYDSADGDDERGLVVNGQTAVPVTENALMRVVADRRGRHCELTLLFTLLCRALGLRTRLTMAMDPLVVQQRSSKAAELLAMNASTTRGKRRRRPRGLEEEDDQQSSDDSAHYDWMWSEVLDEKKNRWMMVDAVRKLVNRPQEVETLRGKGSVLSYVFSVEEDGFIMDVAPRYTDRWSRSLPLRLAHDWIALSLRQLNSRFVQDAGDSSRRESEQQALQQMAEAEAMPTSLEAFKKHHLYCLERHLGQFECVYPKQAVGLFKGHPVYLRKSVQTTRAWFQWRRLGRQVKDDERDRPAKQLGATTKTRTSTASGSSSDDDGDDDRGATMAARGPGKSLYGLWQTEPVVAPCVDGVRVPKNTYGNIELWSAAHLPHGAVHLQLPRIEKVAQQLGIDYAPAVVGFENREGKNCPKMDGIVVAAVVVDTLVDAHAHMQHSLIEKAIDKNQQLVVKRWERLIKRLLLKQRLNDEYGEA